MIVIGADTHKVSHTVGAGDAATGRTMDGQPDRSGEAPRV